MARRRGSKAWWDEQLADLVGSRTGGVPVGLAHLLSPRFLWECLNLQTMSLSPAPATSHVACGLPALRSPAHFTSRVIGPVMLEPLSAVIPDAGLDSH